MRAEQTDTFADPSRRTYLALERTLLAWWRTAFGALGVALAVGRLIPDLAHLPRDPFLGLGAGWGVLSAAFIVYGTLRQQHGERVIRAGGFSHLDTRITSALATYSLLLIVATVAMLFTSN